MSNLVDKEELVKKRGREILQEILEKVDNPVVVLLNSQEIFSMCIRRAYCEIIGLDSADTVHSHECDECGTVWRHDPILTQFEQGDEVYRLAHLCPQCKRPQHRVKKQRVYLMPA